MNLLDVQNLSVTYRQTGWLRRGATERRVLSDVTFAIAPGESLGLVGESGCGKSTLAKALLGLAPISNGQVLFNGEPLALNLRSRRRFQDIQIVFQDPYHSLNPRMSIESLVSEPLRIQRSLAHRAARRERVVELLEAVGLGAPDLQRYPHQLSGGQRQRIGIARALASNPRLLICDEPVSALDVSVQAQVMNLLRKLQRERQLSYLFIGHDLAVVEYISDRIIVMESGRIVETGPAESICLNPQNPYTKRLVQAATLEE